MSTLRVDSIRGQTADGTNRYVVQVVNAENDTSTSTTSTSFTSTSVTATITPKFVSSKILVICQTQLRQTTGTTTGSHIEAKIHRGSTAIGKALDHGTREIAGPNNTDNVSTAGILKVLDSPNTTSATTYTVFIRSRNSACTALINNDEAGSTITLMEIAQ